MILAEYNENCHSLTLYVAARIRYFLTHNRKGRLENITEQPANKANYKCMKREL